MHRNFMISLFIAAQLFGVRSADAAATADDFTAAK